MDRRVRPLSTANSRPKRQPELKILYAWITLLIQSKGWCILISKYCVKNREKRHSPRDLNRTAVTAAAAQLRWNSSWSVCSCRRKTDATTAMTRPDASKKLSRLHFLTFFNVYIGSWSFWYILGKHCSSRIWSMIWSYFLAMRRVNTCLNSHPLCCNMKKIM